MTPYLLVGGTTAFLALGTYGYFTFAVCCFIILVGGTIVIHDVKKAASR